LVGSLYHEPAVEKTPRWEMLEGEARYAGSLEKECVGKRRALEKGIA